jgi:serine/threonine protein kinase
MAAGNPGESDMHREYKTGEDIPFDRAPTFIASSNGVVVDKITGKVDPFKGKCYARKTIIFNGKNQEAGMLKYKKEAKTLHRARHVHVVQLFMTYVSENHFAIVMDLADLSLAKYLSQNKRPQERWFGCLVSVVAYIHKIGIRHRDIKPENILIKSNEVLLADFGISKMGLGITTKTTDHGRDAARTKDYCAPEVDSGSSRGRSADIFSLGAVFVEMLFASSYSNYRLKLRETLKHYDGESYAKKIDQVTKFLAEIERTDKSNGWPCKVISLCTEMLQKKRKNRPPAKKLASDWEASPLSSVLKPCTCAGAGANLTDNNILVDACAEGNKEEVESLLKKGADASIVGAIHHAAVNGNIDIVQALLNKNADVNVQDEDGMTALHYAGRKGHKDVVKLLLRNDADKWIADDNERTAFDHAVDQRHSALKPLLSIAAERGGSRLSRLFIVGGRRRELVD